MLSLGVALRCRCLLLLLQFEGFLFFPGINQKNTNFFRKIMWTNRGMFQLDGERWTVDDDVISRLVEDAIDSESREVLTLSRSRLVQTTWSTLYQGFYLSKQLAAKMFWKTRKRSTSCPAKAACGVACKSCIKSTEFMVESVNMFWAWLSWAARRGLKWAIRRNQNIIIPKNLNCI